ncbi:putative PAS/PAC sensor protein [Chitinispirillum alkaliphilum]|nr:putative PAS/PAC sensor protein [Chitinispirillum alkaliphilum]
MSSEKKTVFSKTSSTKDLPGHSIGQLEAQNEQLKMQLMNASMINELTKVLHSCTDVNNIIKTALLAIQELLGFDRIILFDIQADNFRLCPSHWVGFNDSEVSSLAIPMEFDGGEITDAIFLNRHIIVDEPDRQNDIFYKNFGSAYYLAVPMVSKLNHACKDIKCCSKTSCPAHGGFNPYCWSVMGAGQMLNTRTEDEKRKCCTKCSAFKADGVFWMDRTSKENISSDDITQLTAIINITGILIENSRILKALDSANSNLHKTNEQLQKVNQDLQIAQSKIQNDLEHARTIQQGLLPGNIKSSGSFAVGAQYLSADAVGGDYYDIFEIDPNIYGLVVADVSGHGVASALIMSMAKILLKTFAKDELSPQKTLEKINKTFLSEIRTDNFVTIFYAVLDVNAQKFKFTSAGHCPVLLVDKEKRICTSIKADGLFMGVFPDMMLSEREIDYKPGCNRILLYTDGLVEAQNKDDQMYGIDKLTKATIASLELKPSEAVNAILEDQKHFCGTVTPEDDITILAVDF